MGKQNVQAEKVYCKTFMPVQKSPLGAGQQTLRNARTLTLHHNQASADRSETDESAMMSMTYMPLTL